jgi:hypothetical protein
MSKKTNRKNPLKDDFIEAIGDLVRKRDQLTRQAEQVYVPEVEAILLNQSRDPQRIEHTLDGILDFCFDPEMLRLYKKLYRYYFKIDPQATASYVHAYREMWDEEAFKDQRS